MGPCHGCTSTTWLQQPRLVLHQYCNIEFATMGLSYAHAHCLLHYVRKGYRRRVLTINYYRRRGLLASPNLRLRCEPIGDAVRRVSYRDQIGDAGITRLHKG